METERNFANILYLDEVPENTLVYLTRPDFSVPPSPPEQLRRKPTRSQLLSADKPVEVRQILLSRIIRTKDPPQLKFPYARAVDIDSVLWSLQKIHNMGIYHDRRLCL